MLSVVFPFFLPLQQLADVKRLLNEALCVLHFLSPRSLSIHRSDFFLPFFPPIKLLLRKSGLKQLKWEKNIFKKKFFIGIPLKYYFLQITLFRLLNFFFPGGDKFQVTG